MNRNTILVSALACGVLYLSPVQAHNPGSYGGWSGDISVWAGSPYGTGYAGSINYGSGYRGAPPYAGAHYYEGCGHWHPQSYRPPKGHGYSKGYKHGYADGRYDHHGRKHKSRHKRGKHHGQHGKHHH